MNIGRTLLFAPSSLAAIAQDKGNNNQNWQYGGSYSAIAQNPTKMDRIAGITGASLPCKLWDSVCYGIVIGISAQAKYECRNTIMQMMNKPQYCQYCFYDRPGHSCKSKMSLLVLSAAEHSELEPNIVWSVTQVLQSRSG